MARNTENEPVGWLNPPAGWKRLPDMLLDHDRQMASLDALRDTVRQLAQSSRRKGRLFCFIPGPPGGCTIAFAW